MDHNPQGRRPHFHRGRRGSDRRGSDRRAPQPPAEQGGRPSGDVDVEQIMRDIRARIAQRHGIELSTQQIQELAARRLEAILDPRTVNPKLLEQLRRNAGAPVDVSLPAIDSGFTFDHSTLYETHRGFLRFLRRLFNPLLKLLFNPNPLVQTLSTQARLNKEAAAREAERERRQAEWNALHFEILNRLVTEVSRASIELQAISTRVDSLAGRVDFADRRVRTLESTSATAHSRAGEAAALPRRGEAVSAPGPARPADATSATPPSAVEGATGEGGPKRKRRRRRGRRSGGLQDAAAATGISMAPAAAAEGAVPEEPEGDEIEEGEGELEAAFPEAVVDNAAAEAPVDVVASALGDAAVDESESAEAPGSAEAFAFAEASTSAKATVDETADKPAFAEARVDQPADTSVDRPETSAPPAVQPTPPPDEPMPAAPVDHPDPGPPDR